MLHLYFKDLFKLRGIGNGFTALVNAGISTQSAHKIYSSETRVFRLDHIEIICKLLNCTPNDLLRWTPDKNNTLPDNHALHELKNDGIEAQLHETMNKMTMEQLRQIAVLINEQQSGK